MAGEFAPSPDWAAKTWIPDDTHWGVHFHVRRYLGRVKGEFAVDAATPDRWPPPNGPRTTSPPVPNCQLTIPHSPLIECVILLQHVTPSGPTHLYFGSRSWTQQGRIRPLNRSIMEAHVCCVGGTVRGNQGAVLASVRRFVFQAVRRKTVQPETDIGRHCRVGDGSASKGAGVIEGANESASPPSGTRMGGATRTPRSHSIAPTSGSSCPPQWKPPQS